MKVQYYYSETTGAQLDKEYTTIIENIRKEATKYLTDCIYNIDEIGKYQKIKLDRSLIIFSEYSRKKDKARITTYLIYNTTSIDKLLIQFISKAKYSLYFRYKYLDSLESIRVFWRYNNSTQINSYIIEEYLYYQFDQEIKR